MGQKKHLHELLQDEQEPFHLNHYISDLRFQMRCSSSPKKHKSLSISKNNSNSLLFCNRSCLFTSTKSPNPTKSPIFELPSPVKTQKGHVFLQIPAKTATILLEAAARIQNQQSEKTKSKARNNGNAFGVFGSVLKRLTSRKSKSRLDNGNAVLSKRGSEPTSSSSSRSRRLSFEEIIDGGDVFECHENCFCDSPFRFVLETSPSSSSGHRTPHFTSTATSPATSPTRNSMKKEESDETEEKLEKKEEEDKEQCSPVSVLDPLQEDEDQDHQQHENPQHLNHLSCSFELVQRAKRRLLKKLRRFEKLAGLEPVDLEGKMVEEESEDDENVGGCDSSEEDSSSEVEEERRRKRDEREGKWRVKNAWRVGVEGEEVEEIVRRDVREEAGEWVKYGGDVEEAVAHVELYVFLLLLDELSHELLVSSSCSSCCS